MHPQIPASLSFDQAATIPVAFLAAVTGLFGEKGIGAGLNPDVEWPAPQQTGKTILVIGGSTSVGQYGASNSALCRHLTYNSQSSSLLNSLDSRTS